MPVAGSHVTVVCEDAEPAVAKVLSVNADGDIELEVLPGTVESQQDLLASWTKSSKARPGRWTVRSSVIRCRGR